MSSNKRYIYHEQQESQLCGQHCLNNLLQGPYLSAVDLADIANELDQRERALGNKESLFESANVDDSGNFSIQVLRVALQRFHQSDLEPWFKKRGEAEASLNSHKGFVVNRSNHWFTIRKINNKWWDLNSTIERPEYISDFHLDAHLHQLRANGYSIFNAIGKIPDSNNPAAVEYLPKGSGVWHLEEDLHKSFQVKGGPESASNNFQAFQGKGQKLGGDGTTSTTGGVDIQDILSGAVGDAYDEELELAKAISASLEAASTPVATSAADNKPSNPKDDMRAKRLAALSKLGVN